MPRSRLHKLVVDSRDWSALQDWETVPSSRTSTYSWTDDLIISDNHGINWRDRPAGNVGDDFHCIRRYFKSDMLGPLHLSWSSSDPTAPGGPHYYGVVTAGPQTGAQNSLHPPAPSINRNLLKVLGTRAIAATVPTAPVASLATFLGEAREGLPHAILVADSGKRRTRRCLNAGDEYLNVEFGWKPLVSDVKKFATAVLDRERLWKQYEANSGRDIRRRFDFPTEFNVQQKVGTPKYLGPLNLPGQLYGSQAQTVAQETWKTTTKRWFSATYRYYVPPMGTPEHYLSKANHLLGVKLTPEVLWELAPWSWAADWAFNTGDVMKNISALKTDSLVIKHAFIMEETTIDVNRVARISPDMFKSFKGSAVVSQQFTTVQKFRMRASPYGFGTNWEGFSARQLAILGALGISRY